MLPVLTVLTCNYTTACNHYYILSPGLLTGHKIVGVRMVLQDGVAHIVDSSELAFRLAAAGAMRQGAHSLTRSPLSLPLSLSLSFSLSLFLSPPLSFSLSLSLSLSFFTHSYVHLPSFFPFLLFPFFFIPSFLPP